jgi:hypothetical protein
MVYNIEPQELDLENEAKKRSWNTTVYTFILFLVLLSFLVKIEFFQRFLDPSK